MQNLWSTPWHFCGTRRY